MFEILFLNLTEVNHQFVELSLSDGAGAAAHDVAACIVLGEGDEVADIVGLAEEGA